MHKTLRRRIKQLETLLPPEEPADDDNIEGWLELLDAWPEEYLVKNVYESQDQFEAKTADVRRECQAIARRARAGELTTVHSLCMELPRGAITGMWLRLQDGE